MSSSKTFWFGIPLTVLALLLTGPALAQVVIEDGSPHFGWYENNAFHEVEDYDHVTLAQLEAHRQWACYAWAVNNGNDIVRADIALAITFPGGESGNSWENRAIAPGERFLAANITTMMVNWLNRRFITRTITFTVTPRNGDAMVARRTFTVVDMAISWVEVPDEVEVLENDRVEFDVRGESTDQNARLTLAYHSNDLPDSARFVDHGNGSGTFIWETTNRDAGEYTANFTLSDGEDELEADVSIRVHNLVWAEKPDTVEVNKTELVEFNISGESADTNAVLTIAYHSDDLPDSARFVDHGDGSGGFSWQTGYQDAGEYSAVFTLSDGENELEADVAIIVNNFNSPPEWAEAPDTISVMESRELTFMVSGSDLDGDDLSIRAFSENLPQGWRFTDNGDGTGTFIWTPNLRRAGNYSATFMLSDSDTSIEATVHIIVLRYNSVFDPRLSIPDHFYLSANFPNPFNAVTRVAFGIPKATRVMIRLFDVAGRDVATLVSGEFEAGNYSVVWSAESMVTGVYIMKMETPNFSSVQKVMLVK